jgi:hypothetical protein
MQSIGEVFVLFFVIRSFLHSSFSHSYSFVIRFMIVPEWQGIITKRVVLMMTFITSLGLILGFYSIMSG